jgi:hypothetical protein
MIASLALFIAMLLQLLLPASQLPQAVAQAHTVEMPQSAQALAEPEHPDPTPMTLEVWSRPTPSPSALATPMPAPDTIPVVTDPSRSPARLSLWNGQSVTVIAADQARDAAGTLRWQLPNEGAGWHADSADCGQGVTVIGGHVSLNGFSGAFASLAGIGPGDHVICTDGEGALHQFAPVDYLQVDNAAGVESWMPPWSPALLVYTCAPSLDGTLYVIRFVEVEETL